MPFGGQRCVPKLGGGGFGVHRCGRGNPVGEKTSRAHRIGDVHGCTRHVDGGLARPVPRLVREGRHAPRCELGLPLELVGARREPFGRGRESFGAEERSEELAPALCRGKQRLLEPALGQQDDLLELGGRQPEQPAYLGVDLGETSGAGDPVPVRPCEQGS